MADAFFHLGEIYHYRSNNSDAAPVYAHALTIWENASMMDSANAISAQATLGNIYRAEGKYAQAEPLLARTLELRSTSLDRTASKLPTA